VFLSTASHSSADYVRFRPAATGILNHCVSTATLVEPIDEMHWPLIGLVWQRLMASGKVAAPVVAVAVIEALAPTSTVATSSRGVMMSRHLMIPPSPRDDSIPGSLFD
jgi:hypothetical protein